MCQSSLEKAATHRLKTSEHSKFVAASPSSALNSLGQTKNVELIRADAFVEKHFYGMPLNVVVVVIVVFYFIVVVVVVAVIAVVVVFVETF